MIVKRKKQEDKVNTLINRTRIKVRFSEVDSLKIVWHGNFIKYFEDGRESFGKEYGLGYLDFYRVKLVTPVVDIKCNYKKYLLYGDEIIVETEFINTDAAKIIFDYRLFNAKDNELVATGRSVQVFLTADGELILTNPEYFLNWKKEHHLI